MDSHDYETNRNLTLLFFLEKLMVEKGNNGVNGLNFVPNFGTGNGTAGSGGGSSRSLHDLSCQFGTRGFSKEMRQIAGGSQAGLRKFLQQYPSLFTIEGEQVSVTQNFSHHHGAADGEGNGGPDGGGGSSSSSSALFGGRDYTREALQYFKGRLKAYGPGTEVPVKSLLGHRSQAPPEVRHISGQHAKEFREFLLKFPDEFVVREDDDVIYLKEYEGQIRHQCSDLEQQQSFWGSGSVSGNGHHGAAAITTTTTTTAAKIDPKVTAKILCFVRKELDGSGSGTVDDGGGGDGLSVEEVFERTTSYFGRTPEQTQQQQQQGGGDQQQALPPPPMMPFRRLQDLDTFLRMHSHLFRVHSGRVSLIPPKQNCYLYGGGGASKASGQGQQLASSSSGPDSLSPPSSFMVTTVTPSRSGTSAAAAAATAGGGTTSTSSTPSSPSTGGGTGSSSSLLNQTLKQRVNSIVLKALADNSITDRDRKPAIRAANVSNSNSNNNNDDISGGNHHNGNVACLQQQQQQGLNVGTSGRNKGCTSINNLALVQAFSSPSVTADLVEAAREDILRATRVIMTFRECVQVVDHIMREGRPVAVDAEGVNLGSRGQITLIQVSTMERQAYIFDLMSDPRMLIEGRLKELLESTAVVKVFHDCKNDSGALHSQHGILMQNVFDTQAAHAVLELQDFGKPVYKVKNVSLNVLCEMYGASANPIKDQMKAVYKRDQRIWTRRPLNVDMICYAAADVLSLLPTVYLSMNSAIKPEFANLFQELCEEQVMLYIDPDLIKSKKKQRKIDFEVSDLRLKLANTTGKNIVLSNREIRLLRHVELTDEDKERLKGSYKVAKKLEKLENRHRAGQEGLDSDDDSDRECTNEQELPSLESVGSDSSEQSMASLSSPAFVSSPAPPPLGTGGGGGSSSSSMTSPQRSCHQVASSSGATTTGSMMAPPPNLTDSMEQVNKILADSSLDRAERIDKLEALLTEMTEAFASSSLQRRLLNNGAGGGGSSRGNLVDASTQTVSTGDINITKVYSENSYQPQR